MYPSGEQPYSGPQYPPGYPHQPQYQQPHGHPAYPPYPPPGYPPAPIPPTPWEAAPAPPSPPGPSNRLGVGVAFGVAILTMVFVAGYMFMVMPRGDQYFTSGAQVTPSADEYIVFIKDKDLSGQLPSTVRCTGITDSGQRLTLSPPAEPVTVSRNRRPATKYRSVAQLPTDRGPLTVNCTGVEDARFLLTKPYTGPGAWVFFAGYGTLLGVLVLVAWWANRRYYRRLAAHLAAPPR